MIHQILFLALYAALLPSMLVSPVAGALVYKWLEYLPPNQTYSLTLIPGDLSLFTAALTFVVWLIREKKTFPRPPGLVWLIVALWIWMNITTYFALAPDSAFPKWERTIKVVGFAMLTAQMLTTRKRLEGFIWVLILCVAYFAIPGAIRTIISRGGGKVAEGLAVVGDLRSFIGDRVAFAVVLPMVVPFVLYLGKHMTLLPRTRLMRLGTLGTAATMGIALIGTYARTALFSGGATVLLLLLRMRRKGTIVLGAAAVALLVYAAAPETWLARMDTIVHYQHDASAEGRLHVWKWSWETALAHPIVGGGFRVFVLDAGADGLSPDKYTEAHNIFFEMAAEHGFVGLGLFCWILLAGYLSCGKVARSARDREDLAWARDLARAVQIGLVAFVAGGMFISISTSPFLYDLLAIAIGLRTAVERQVAAAPAVAAPGAALSMQPAQ